MFQPADSTKISKVLVIEKETRKQTMAKRVAADCKDMITSHIFTSSGLIQNTKLTSCQVARTAHSN